MDKLNPPDEPAKQTAGKRRINSIHSIGLILSNQYQMRDLNPPDEPAKRQVMGVIFEAKPKNLSLIRPDASLRSA